MNDTLRYGKAWLARRKDLYLLHLEGDDYEMGLQHAKLMEGQIRSGVWSLFPNFLRYNIRATGFGLSRAGTEVAYRALRRMIIQPYLKGFQPEDTELWFGMADGLSIPREEMLEALIGPDIFQALPAVAFGKNPLYRRFSPLGCTSFSAGPKDTANGRMLVGHNKDYPGMEYWDPFHTAIFLVPKVGFRFVLFSTAGVMSGSLAGMNEHGLTVAVHTLLTRDVGPDGLPVMVVGNRLLRHCKTVDEALAYLRPLRTQVGWHFMIADGNSAASVEMTNSAMRAQIAPGGTMAYNNLHRIESFYGDELNVNTTMMNNFHNRLGRMNSLLREHQGRHCPETGVAMLGDHWDALNEQTRATGLVMTQMTNVMSFLAEPGTGNFWMATGRAPSCNTSYAGFHIDDGLGDGPGWCLNPDFDSPHKDTPMFHGLRQYILAHDAYFVERDFDKADARLQKAEKLDASEPYYPFLRGIIALQLGRYEDAERLFQAVLNYPVETHRKALCKLWIARSLDLRLRFLAARPYYHELSTDTAVDPRVRKAAKRHLLMPYNRLRLAGLSIDFWLADTFDY